MKRNLIKYNYSITVLNNGRVRMMRFLVPQLIDLDRGSIDSSSTVYDRKINNALTGHNAVVNNVIGDIDKEICSIPFVNERVLELFEKRDVLLNKVNKDLNKCINKYTVINDELIRRKRAVNRRKSALRSFKRVKMISQNNYKRFITMITLTFDINNTKYDNKYDSFDIKDANRKLNSYLTFLRTNSNDDVFYIGVPEKQKNGSIHYHILISIPVGSDLIPERPLKTVKSEGKLRSMCYYDLPGWSCGFSTAVEINSSSMALKYITKYITKETTDFDLPAGSHRYFLSHNLDIPTVYYLNIPADEVGDFVPFIDWYNADNKSYVTYNKEWQIIQYNVMFDESVVVNLNNDLDKYNRYLVHTKLL